MSPSGQLLVWVNMQIYLPMYVQNEYLCKVARLEPSRSPILEMSTWIHSQNHRAFDPSARELEGAPESDLVGKNWTVLEVTWMKVP